MKTKTTYDILPCNKTFRIFGNSSGETVDRNNADEVLKTLSNRQSSVTFRPETDEIKLKSFKTNSAFSTGKLFLPTRHEEPERTPTPAIKSGRDEKYASLC